MTQFVANGESQEYVLVVKDRKFPWWILLFLLPLLLLIPIKRSVHVQILDNAGQPAAQQNCGFHYLDVSTFGSKTPVDLSLTTNDAAKFDVENISQPLWYVLFGGSVDSAFVNSERECQAVHFGDKFKNYPEDDYKIVKMSGGLADKTVKVIDAETKEPLPDAEVKYLDKVSNTDGQGQVSLQLDLCNAITIIASKKGYVSGNFQGKVSDVNGNVITIPLSKISYDKVVKVIDAETQKPIPGAKVKFNGKDYTTDNNGQVKIKINEGDAINLEASKAGYITEIVKTTVDEAGDTIVIPLKKDVETKTIKVIDADTKKPLPGAVVKHNGKNYTTDMNGIVTITIPKNSNVNLEASKEGYNSATVNRKVSEPTLEVPLKKKQQDNINDLKGKTGELKINIQWYCHADLDLQVIDPCGNELSVEKKRSSCRGGSGTFDLDANMTYTDRNGKYLPNGQKHVNNPQENAYWTKATKGTYTIRVVRYHSHDVSRTAPVKFNVTVVDLGTRHEFPGTIQNQRDSIYTFKYEVK
ncbi:MAG: hypothetical protein II956_11400 [Bacteroidales bacterium]|nr:hypothetical protein [Bacteroidales bacterium]